MALPVLSQFAQELPGSDPLHVGLIMGSYGLTQALFQVPLGWCSDRFGRIKILALGMLLMTVGSLISALSSHANTLLCGRLIQGMGAIGGVIMACVADSTRPQNRSIAMALLGSGLGLAFLAALFLGPWIRHLHGVRHLFWAAAGIGLFNLFLLLFCPSKQHHAVQSKAPATTIIFTTDQIRLNLSALFLHASLIIVFSQLERLWQQYFKHFSYHQGLLLLIAVSLLLALLSLQITGKNETPGQGDRRLWVWIGSAVMGHFLIFFSAEQGWGPGLFSAGLLLYFTAFCTLEAILPSAVSKRSLPEHRGSSLGLYHSMMFLGIFMGGLLVGCSTKFQMKTSLLPPLIGGLWIFMLRYSRFKQSLVHTVNNIVKR